MEGKIDGENCVGRKRLEYINQEVKHKGSGGHTDILFANYDEEGNISFRQIIMEDEPWVSHITPESKQQSMEWWYKKSPVKVNS